MFQSTTHTTTVYLAAKGDNQDMSKTTPLAIRTKVCGAEAITVSDSSNPYTLEYDGLEGTPILDSSGNELYREVYIAESIVQGFFSVNDAECPFYYYRLARSTDGANMNTASGINYISIESTSPASGTKLIIKTNVPATISYTFYIEAKTMGAVIAYKEV